MKPAMTALPDYRKNFPGDFAYWTEKGWLDKNTRFFYDTKLKLHQRILGWLIRTLSRTLAPVIAPK
jgi:hypothetical protein